MISTVRSDPKNLGLFLAAAENRSNANSNSKTPLVLEAKKSVKCSKAASIGLKVLAVAVFILANIYVAPFIGAYVGGSVAGSIIVNTIAVSGFLYSEKAIDKLGARADKQHNADHTKETNELSKSVAKSFNENRTIRKNDGEEKFKDFAEKSGLKDLV